MMISAVSSFFAVALCHPGAGTVAAKPQPLAGPSIEGSNPAHAGEFAAFVQKFGREYRLGSEEYEDRQQLFGQHLQRVLEFNARPQQSWRAAVNGLHDRSHSELKRLLGWNRRAHPGIRGNVAGVPTGGLELYSLQPTGPRGEFGSKKSLPESVSYKELASAQNVRDQGDCGSCWAEATATVVRAHAELYREDQEFSVQEIVDCTPNPHKCGGAGGCDGATAELAMEYILNNGLRTDEEYSDCPASIMMNSHGLGSGNALGMVSWETLPSNQAHDLMRALVTNGPAVVSVAVDEQWFYYSSGVMDTCNPETPVVNHAVALIGYGMQEVGGLVVGFWEIQNSWGATWGDQGFIKLKRDGDKSDTWCGWDDKPKEGVACEDDPEERVWVCGMCGVLYDSVVPQFTHHHNSTTSLTVGRHTTQLRGHKL